MQHRLTTSIEVPAPADRVWAVLTDLDRWHEWNPFITSASGTLAVGERLRLRFEPPGSRATTFRPRVTTFEPGRRLSWLGRLGLPGLFDGHHHLDLEPNDGGTLLRHEEDFSGLLVRPLRPSLDEHTRAGFEAMNAALADRVTNGVTGT